MDDLYIRRGSSVKGPFTLNKVQVLLAKNEIKANDLIRAGNCGPWYEMKEVHKDIRKGDWPPVETAKGDKELRDGSEDPYEYDYEYSDDYDDAYGVYKEEAVLPNPSFRPAKKPAASGKGSGVKSESTAAGDKLASGPLPAIPFWVLVLLFPPLLPILLLYRGLRLIQWGGVQLATVVLGFFVVFLLYTMFSDTSVETSAGGRVHNIGLMQRQQNFMIFAGLGIVGSGVWLLVEKKKRDS